MVDRLGTGGPKWLAEFRFVSVICINFLGAVFDGDLLDFLQPCILEVQRVAADLEGVIFGVWMDDKGICVALVFGAPPLAHEEDPLRAVEAGLRIQKELRHRYARASIGIGSGKLFCGDYGGRSRRDYGLLGPAMNTAARLMEMADGGFLCDAATAQAVGDRVSFSVLQSQHMKGRATRSPSLSPNRHADETAGAVSRRDRRSKMGSGGNCEQSSSKLRREWVAWSSSKVNRESASRAC